MLNESRTTLLIFLSVFISSITFFTSPFEGYFHYIIFLILLPVFYRKFGLPMAPFSIAGVLFVLGALQIYAGNNTWAQFFKILIGVVLSATFYYYVLQHYQLDTGRIFTLYLKGMYFISLIGIFQVISYYVGFKQGYNFSWIFNKWGLVRNESGGIRMNSVFSEASQFGIMASPAILLSFYNFIYRKDLFLHRQKCLIILFAIFLTTSSTGFIGILVALILLLINYARFSNIIITVLGISFFFNILYQQVPEFRKRVNSTLDIWIYQEYSLESMNSSSFVLYNNFQIARKNFVNNPIAGTGLGSHAIAFDKYSLTNQQEFLDIEFNKSDANSLFLRLLSETGLIGMIALLYFIIAFYVRKKPSAYSDDSWIISNSVLTIIFLYLLRQGNYFLNGFPIFLWIYYYTHYNTKIKSNLST